MRQVADNLRKQVYIDDGKVEALRKYIRVRNPGCSDEMLAAVFADALHKVINARICQFEEEHRKRIKAAVLKKAVKKSGFSINAADVFSSCLAVKSHEDSYIQSFTRWINQNQPAAVSPKELDMLLSRAEQFDEDYIEDNIEHIIDEYEDSRSEDSTFEILQTYAGAPAELQAYEELADDEEGKPAALFTGFAAAIRDNLKYLKPSIKLAVPAVIPLAAVVVLVVSGLSGDRVQALKFKGEGRYAVIAEDQVDRYLSLEARMLEKLGGLTGEGGLILRDGLHGEFRYEAVDEGKLRKWLERRNSILLEEPYFTAILETSRKYDIHPALMFAIVGQEQGFVPKDGAAAREIANNPFNVYGSWEKYNTDIYDSSSLAASTIIESSRNRPAYMNTIRWINRRYAEDPNWWNGVSSIFEQIKKEI